MLDVKNLNINLNTVYGNATAVRNLSFKLERGKTLGIVGESGCGKSLTALAIMGLLPENSWSNGEIIFNNKNLLNFNEDKLCKIRGNSIGMIFQEPMTSLNPLHTIGKQIAEPMILHGKVPRSMIKQEVIKLLDMVGIPDPSKRISLF